MKIIPLYRYIRPDGGTTVSLVKPDNGIYSEAFRLVADPGKILTYPDRDATCCVDVDSVEGWQEMVDPTIETGQDPDEATAEDYLSALGELGVNIDEES